MKIKNEVNDVQSGGITEVNAFQIKTTASAFRILSSGLYSNKIKAIIRELSCNAVDSHIEVGTPDLPFDVHLPNGIEPYFAVRDYGTGLSHEDVMGLYTTYFSSTKQNSNDYTGALGLGSKSPFSYTENFSVTSILNGEQRVYTALIDASGCPSIALMSTTETTEGNGIEVKFAVSDTTDFYNFRKEAVNVLQWFAVRPTINLSDDEFPKLDLEHITDGIDLRRSGNTPNPKTVAIQGNVAYPIDYSLVTSNRILSKFQKTALTAGFVLHFNIGDLDVAASREELSYVEYTLDSIVEKLKEVEEHFKKYVTNELKTVKTTWDTGAVVSRLYDNVICREVMRDVLKDLDIDMYHSTRPSFLIDVSTFKDQNLNLMQFEEKMQGAIGRVTHSSTYNHDTQERIAGHRVQWSEKPTLYFNDTTHGASDILKAHMKDKDIKLAMVVQRIKKTEDDVDSAIKKAVAILGNPTKVKVVRLSTLVKAVPKLAPAQRAITSPIHIYVIDASSRYGNVIVKGAGNLVDLQDTTTVRYYFPLAIDGRDRHLICPNGTEQGVHNVRDFLTYVGDKVLNKFNGRSDKLFGVGPRRIEEIKKAPNWICVFDEFTKYLNGTSASVSIAQALPNRVGDEYIGEDLKNVTELLDSTSPFVVHWRECKKIIKDSERALGTSYGRSYLKNCANNFGIEIKEKYQAEVDAMKAKHKAIEAMYPMLSIVYQHGTNEDSTLKMAEYIEMIDCLNKSNK